MSSRVEEPLICGNCGEKMLHPTDHVYDGKMFHDLICYLDYKWGKLGYLKGLRLVQPKEKSSD